MGCGCEAARSTRGGVGGERTRRAERRDRLPYNDKVRDEQRFGTAVREELRAMFFSASHSSRAGDDAADFYRKYVGEFDVLYRNGWTATDAARMTGDKHGVAHFRGHARFVPDVVSKAKAADRRYGYFRPDDQFVVETGNLEEGPRKKIAERILDKADDPYVSVSVGRLIVAPSKHSYFGDELFVAIKEAIHRPHRFEPGGNRFVLL